MTPAWMKRMHFYYHDPEHPDRLVSDIAGGVVVLISILILFFWLPL